MRIIVVISFLFLLNLGVQGQQEIEKWRNIFKSANLVVLAKVIEVKEAPGFWSGQFAAKQNVRFRIVEVQKGVYDDDVLELEYYVAKGSPLVEADRPNLSPVIFKLGNQLTLFLKSRRKTKSYFRIEDNLGTLCSKSEILKSLFPN